MTRTITIAAILLLTLTNLGTALAQQSSAPIFCEGMTLHLGMKRSEVLDQINAVAHLSIVKNSSRRDKALNTWITKKKRDLHSIVALLTFDLDSDRLSRIAIEKFDFEDGPESMARAIFNALSECSKLKLIGINTLKDSDDGVSTILMYEDREVHIGGVTLNGIQGANVTTVYPRETY